MPFVAISPEAAEDLREIGDYIAKDSPFHALQLTNALKERFLAIAGQPYMGVARDDFLPGMRMLPYKNYLILYRPRKNDIEIIRVLHSARDIRALFDKL